MQGDCGARLGGVTTSEDATGSSKVGMGVQILASQWGSSDKLIRQLLLLMAGGEGWYRERSQTVILILHANSDIKFDSIVVCLSHDMHVTYSHEVYRQWVAAGWSHPFSHSHLPHNGLVDSSVQCHQWLQQRSPSTDMYICQELLPLRSGA